MPEYAALKVILGKTYHMNFAGGLDQGDMDKVRKYETG